MIIYWIIYSIFAFEQICYGEGRGRLPKVRTTYIANCVQPVKIRVERKIVWKWVNCDLSVRRRFVNVIWCGTTKTIMMARTSSIMAKQRVHDQPWQCFKTSHYLSQSVLEANPHPQNLSLTLRASSCLMWKKSIIRFMVINDMYSPHIFRDSSLFDRLTIDIAWHNRDCYRITVH